MAKKTGFALLAPEERARLGRRGGKRAHKNGTAHTFTPKEAREAASRGHKPEAVPGFEWQWDGYKWRLVKA